MWTDSETEVYEWDPKLERISVTMEYASGSFNGKRSKMQQHGWVFNKETGSEWRVSPKVGCFYLPIKLKYLIIGSADDYSSLTVGYPDRSLLWIMTRDPNPAAEVMEALIQEAVDQGYDRSMIKPIPQRW